MLQWKYDDFCKMLRKNGYYLDRQKGSHSIFKNTEGNHISIPRKISMVVANRLIKENNLNNKK